MTRFAIDPEHSQVWIEGSSSVHPVHATATGLEGWLELSPPARRCRTVPRDRRHRHLVGTRRVGPRIRIVAEAG